MNIFKKAITTLLIVIILSIMSSTAMAGAPPAVPGKPTPVPEAPPSGVSNSYTSPPAFQPYTEDLKSSDGSVVGTMSGLDYSTVRLSASCNATIGGDAISIDIGVDLNSKPSGATLDVAIGDDGSLPEGMSDVVILSTAKITVGSTYGWSVKSGTPTVKFTMPASRLEGAVNDTKFYLVRDDGTGYQITAVSAVVSDDTATVEAKVPDISGTFTAVMSCPPGPVAVTSPTSEPVPAVTPVSTPAPCPTPAPAQGGVFGWLSSLWVPMFGTFAIGEVAGAMVLLVVGRFTK